MSENELNRIIANNISKQLELHNKTQLDLAEYMNVSQATVSNWCKGLKMPRMSKIDMICEFFSIQRSDLLNDVESKHLTENDQYYLNDETRQIAQEAFENPELRTLFKVARDIPPERLKAHIEFMKTLKEQERGYNDEGC